MALPSLDSEGVECALEDLRVRLALADLGREDGEVEPLGHSELLQVAVEEPAGIERVRDEPELEAAVPQRLEQGVRVAREHARRIPRRVLGLEKAAQLLLVDGDPGVLEHFPDEARVVDLVEGSLEESRDRGEPCFRVEEAVILGQPLGPDRLEARTLACRDQLHVPRELHQRVAPVEENGLEHGSLG